MFVLFTAWKVKPSKIKIMAVADTISKGGQGKIIGSLKILGMHKQPEYNFEYSPVAVSIIEQSLADSLLQDI